MLVDNPRFNRIPLKQVAERAVVYFKSLRAMGYSALGVGTHEMLLDVKTLKKLSRKHRVALVSSSIVRSEDSQPVFNQSMVKQVGRLRICLIGLLTGSPEEYGKLFVDKGYEVLKPVPAAKRAVKALRGKRCHMIVALSQLRRDEIDSVAEKVPELDLVLGSNSQSLSNSLERVGGAYFGDCFNKGKYVGELLVSPGRDLRRFAIANLRATLENERLSLARRIRDIVSQLEESEKADGAIKLTPESRQILQQNLVGLRAKLQRVTMDMEGAGAGSGGASLLALQLHPLARDTKDNPRVLKVVERYKKKWKVKGAGH